MSIVSVVLLSRLSRYKYRRAHGGSNRVYPEAHRRSSVVCRGGSRSGVL